MRLVLTFLFVSSALSKIAYDIDGLGSDAGSPMMKLWEFSYSLLKDDVAMTFTPVPSQSAFSSLQTQCRKNYQTDFIVSDINWKNWRNYSDAMMVRPFFATAIVITYNVPELQSQAVPLTLNHRLIYDIWSQRITTWDHPDIKLANPNLQFPPNKTIQLVVRSDDTGFNSLFQSFLVLEEKAANFPWKNFQNFTAGYTWTRKYPVNNTQPIRAPGSFAMAATVLTTNYSMGYVPYAYSDQAGLPYALLTTTEGGVALPPDDQYLSAAVDELQSQGISYQSLTNRGLAGVKKNNSYPLTAIVFLAYMNDTSVDCAQRREVWKFLKWILKSDAAAGQIHGTVGYTPFNMDTRNALLGDLGQITCQDEILLANTFSDSSSTYLRQAALSISAILLSIVILIGVTLGLKRNNRITKAAGLAFAYCFLIGCALNYISVFIWAQVPDADSLCSARYILVSLGYTLILGSMFAKCWEVRKIFARAKSGDISPFQELPWWKFCQVFFAVTSVNCIILLGLGVSDPPKTYQQETDDINLVAVHVCGVMKVGAWAGLEFAYFASLVLWGGYLAYTTRDIWDKYNYPNESKSILLSIYNLVFCFCILLPLMTLLKGSIEVVFFFVATAIIFPTSFSLFMVYGPKMMIFLSSSFKGSREGSQGMASKKPSKAKDSGVQRTLYEDGMKQREVERAKDEDYKRRVVQERDEKNEVIVEEDTEEHNMQTPGQRSPGLPSAVSSAHSPAGDWRVLSDESGRHATTESTHFEFQHDKH